MESGLCFLNVGVVLKMGEGEILQDNKTVEQIVDDMNLFDDAVGKLMHDFGCKYSKDIYYPELAKGVKHFKEEEGGRKAMCEAVEKYAEKKVAVKVREERSLMTQIVAALVADKDNDTIIKELNCTLEQIIPLRTVMGK